MTAKAMMSGTTMASRMQSRRAGANAFWQVFRLWALFLLVGSALAAPAPETSVSLADDNHWVVTWTSMPQQVEPNNMPPSPFNGGGVFKDATLRQTLLMTIGADRIRVQISNTFGGSPLPITAASIALPTGGKVGVGGIDTTTLKGLTFGGAESVSIPRGEVIYSDPIDFKIEPRSMLTVTLYSQAGQSGSQITGHPGSRTTSWMQQGNHVNETDVKGSTTKHWYFVSAVEAWAPKDYSSLIILGDSITDGRGSDDDHNNRWPDLLLARMQKEGITNIGVGNQAAGGNTVLSGGLGPPLMSRYKRDAITQQGVKYVLIFEGVNDIGNAGGDPSGQLINAFKTIIAAAKEAGYVTIGATITPFGGNSYSSGGHEQARKKVNDWIMAKGNFDYAVDFSSIIGQGDRLQQAYNSGDGLHPSVAGYQEIADKFPLDIFKGNSTA